MPTDRLAEGIEVDRVYLDDGGDPVGRIRVGDELTVRLRVRSKGGRITNVAVTDLLPGGFESTTALVAGVRSRRDLGHGIRTSYSFPSAPFGLPRGRTGRRGGRSPVLGRGGWRCSKDVLVRRPAPRGQDRAGGELLLDAPNGAIHRAGGGRPRSRRLRADPGRRIPGAVTAATNESPTR